MATKRRPAKPSQLSKSLSALTKSVKTAARSVQAAKLARAKKAKARADAQELADIESRLGEDFTSLSAARRAWKKETQAVTKKQAAAVRQRAKAAAAAAKATTPQGKPSKPRKARPAPATPIPEQPAPPPPPPAPAGPQLPSGRSFPLSDLTAGSLPEVLDRLDSGLGAQLDAQLRPGEELRVTVFGRGTKHQQFFQSFVQLSKYCRRYLVKGFHNWSQQSQQTLLENIRIVRPAAEAGPAEARAERVIERQKEAAAVREKYKGKTLLEANIEENARLRSEKAELQEQVKAQALKIANLEAGQREIENLKAMVEKLMKGQK